MIQPLVRLSSPFLINREMYDALQTPHPFHKRIPNITLLRLPPQSKYLQTFLFLRRINVSERRFDVPFHLQRTIIEFKIAHHIGIQPPHVFPQLLHPIDSDHRIEDGEMKEQLHAMELCLWITRLQTFARLTNTRFRRD